VPQGMPVIIPLYGFAHDEKYFDEPFTFNPDRKIQHGKSLPFGIGARVCFGERIALIILKTAVIKLLKDFRVEINEKTPEKLTIGKKAFILQYNENLNVTFVKD
jgi:cytochrome P450 family 3 subfamily A